MAGASSSEAAAVAAVSGSPSSPKSTNTKWNEEAHRALIGTLLDVMDSSDTKWRAHLDLMVENMAGRGQQFSREGIRQHLQKLKRKEGAGTPKKAAALGKKRGKATAENDDETPKKKQRKTAMSEPAEHDDEEAVDMQLKHEHEEEHDED